MSFDKATKKKSRWIWIVLSVMTTFALAPSEGCAYCEENAGANCG